MVERISNAWWRSEDNKHSLVFSTVSTLKSKQAYLEERNLRNASLYSGRLICSFGPGEAFDSKLGIEQFYLVSGRPVALNVTKACIDTVTAKVTAIVPRVQALVSGGDYSLQKKARLLEKFSDGVLYGAGFVAEAKKAYCDSAKYGTGFVKFWTEKGSILCERVHPSEVIVDDRASHWGSPRALFQERYLPRELLLAEYPDHEEAIWASPGLTNGADQEDIGLVKVIEAWHLPSGGSQNDGKHVICIERVTLFEEAYSEEDFPFIVVRWQEREDGGFFGLGMVEVGEGIQLEINNLAYLIQENMSIFARPIFWVRKGSKVERDQLAKLAQPGLVLEYEGEAPPKTQINQINSPEVYQQLNTLFNKYFEIQGVSQLTSMGQKPAGIDSGIAIRTLIDVETLRFGPQAKLWEEMFKVAVERIVPLGKRLYTKKKSLDIVGEKAMESLSWSDIDLKESQYQLKLYPVNSLPQTPTGKIATITDLMKLGLIGPARAKQLLDFPDLEEYLNLENAAIDDIKQVIEAILEGKEYRPPEPYQNLALGLEMVGAAFLRYRWENVSEGRLELLKRWVLEADDLLSQKEAPPPMEGPVGPSLPPEAMAPTPPPPTMLGGLDRVLNAPPPQA